MTELELPEAVARCLAHDAPEALRMGVAQGLIPQGPAERLVTLARLLGDPAPAVREAARAAWKGLPVSLTRSALTDPHLPGWVLDFVAVLHPDTPEILCGVLEHVGVGIRTIERLIDSTDEEVVARVAQNQRLLCERLDLVRRLLSNPKLHPSDRSHLEAFCPPDEAEQPTIDPELGEAVPAELLEDSADELGETASKNLYQLVQSLSVAQKIKLATVGSKGARRLLVRDTNKVVALAVIHSPKIREDEVQAIAQDRTAHDDLIRIILTRKDWLKTYPIRLALCQNPKTPVPKAIRLLETLQDRDLRQIAKSRNVASPVSTGALRLLSRRGKV